MWFYAGLGISVGIWITLGIYVFAQMKKTYARKAILSNRFLIIWFIMWGFHHVPVILSSLYGVWLLPLDKMGGLIGGLVMIVVGAVTMATGMLEFRSLRRSTGQDTSGLMTVGIYRWSRNPQFIGWLLILSGVSLMGRSGLAFVLTIVFAIVIHLYTTLLEEPYLERIFREEYRLYKSRTARYIGIPKKGKNSIPEVG